MSFIGPIVRNLRHVRAPTIVLSHRSCVRPAIQRIPFPKPMYRHMASKSDADAAIEEITELYATAQDEFEIAMEETEKMSVYAEEDRQAARTELETVQAAYKKIVEGPNKQVAEEVSRRIGQRIRELENGIKRMEEIAMEHD